ncbi:MAG TPA: phosphoserine phosphatase SerB, partial [Beijerinckiaceae bacterium]|nr:phosphoserine phosphatase SerB [Beijerinckiaceae bacterium]
MVLVATLISNPCAPAITDAVLRAAGRALATGHPPHRLHGEIAADLLFDDEGGRRVAALRAALAGAPIDIVAQPARQRRKLLFLADMDSTMIEQECIDELAGTLGLKDHVAAITERTMRGEIAFEPALRERVALLKNIPVAAVDVLITEQL